MSSDFPPSAIGGRLRLSLLLATSAIAALPISAFAADPGAISGTTAAIELPTVSVQGAAAQSGTTDQGFVAKDGTAGTKTNTPLLETPQSVSVITREQLNARDVQNVEQALGYTAGVNAAPFGATDPRFDSPVIRGFSAANNIYLDGLKLVDRSSGAPAYEPYGLQRIEVIKGPGSVLYGQTAPGGLVDLEAKKPTMLPLHEVNLEGGSFGRSVESFDLGGPVPGADGNTLSYRLTGLARQSGTQVDNVNDNRYFIAPAVTYHPDDKTTITLLGRYQYDRSGTIVGLPAAGTLYASPFGRLPTNLDVGGGDFNRVNHQQYNVGTAIEHRFSDAFTVRQNIRYLRDDFDYQSLYASALEANGRTLDRGSFVGRERINQFNIDNQAELHLATGPVTHTVLVGLDYRRTWSDVRYAFGSAPSIDLYAPIETLPVTIPNVSSNTHQTINQLGLYAQDQARLGNLILTGSVREDIVSLNSYEQVSGNRTTQHPTATTGRAGLIYVTDVGVAPYVSYSTSFDPTAGTTAAGSAFQPTKGEQYEGGVKYQPHGFNSFVTLSAYNLTQDNALTTDPNHPGFNLQTGQIRVRGIELETTLSLAQGLGAIIALSQMDPVVTRSNGADLGKRPVNVPKQMASVWGDYTVQEGSRFSGVGLGAGMRYLGARYGDAANTLLSRPVALFDAALRYDLSDKWRFHVNAKNLFDRVTVASCSSSVSCFYGERLNVTGGVSYRW
jgi:iron complex outermembrane receptor protein